MLRILLTFWSQALVIEESEGFLQSGVTVGMMHGEQYRLLPEHSKVAQGGRMQLSAWGSHCPAEFTGINDA